MSKHISCPSESVVMKTATTIHLFRQLLLFGLEDVKDLMNSFEIDSSDFQLAFMNKLQSRMNSVDFDL